MSPMSNEHLTPGERRVLEDELRREERRPWRWDLIGCVIVLVVAMIIGGVLYGREKSARFDRIDPTTEAQPDQSPRR